MYTQIHISGHTAIGMQKQIHISGHFFYRYADMNTYKQKLFVQVCRHKYIQVEIIPIGMYTQIIYIQVDIISIAMQTKIIQVDIISIVMLTQIHTSGHNCYRIDTAQFDLSHLSQCKMLLTMFKSNLKYKHRYNFFLICTNVLNNFQIFRMYPRIPLSIPQLRKARTDPAQHTLFGCTFHTLGAQLMQARVPNPRAKGRNRLMARVLSPSSQIYMFIHL